MNHPPTHTLPPRAVLVIGLGNPILGDDGVGWRVAEEVKNRVSVMEDPKSQAFNAKSQIRVECFSLGGLSLMEQMVGYDRAVVIDAVVSGQPEGTVSQFALNDLPGLTAVHANSVHDASLQIALTLGRRLGAHLPAQVMVVGVEATHLFDFCEGLTPAVEAAVPRAADAVMNLLNSFR